MLPSLHSGSVREGQGQTLGLGAQGLFLGDTDKGKVGESKGLQSKAVLVTYATPGQGLTDRKPQPS